MQTALVIGGTRGFGKEICNNLKKKSFNIFTIGRSEDADFQIDISNKTDFQRVLEEIKIKLPKINLIFCVIGFAGAKKPNQLTKEDWVKAFQCNIGFINQTLNTLRGNVNQVNGKVIIFGSKWSFRRDCNLIKPYIIAKHQIIELNRIKSKEFNMLCFCVPSMNTPGLKAVNLSFNKLGIKTIPLCKLGSSKRIAKIIVKKTLDKTQPGDIFLISPRGNIRNIKKQIK
ncbi:SDR family oxidoreductase [Candidatus Pacearchaeota archaeon]|nr:SDR family oxidoreductase [Candidatus Pacearchaeota archaeon]